MRNMINISFATLFCAIMISNGALAATTADPNAVPVEEAVDPNAFPVDEEVDRNPVTVVECPDPEPLPKEQEIDPSELLVVGSGDEEEMVICIEAIYELAAGKAPKAAVEMCLQGQIEAALEFVVMAAQ